MTWLRFGLLPYVLARDTLQADLRIVPPTRQGVWDEALDAGVRWLCLTHDVTQRNGCSKGFSLLFGWAPPFPETTGYIIGTLLACSVRLGIPALSERAREMGEWEIGVQNDDGGVIEGLLTAERKQSTVFNTGMVMHGWLDLNEFEPNDDFVEAALRGGAFLLRHQDEDGAWRGHAEYYGIPHTYNARVAWALLRLAAVTGDERFGRAGRRQLDWVLTMQRDNGWFEACAFKPGMLPSTHSIAYTLRGLVESFTLVSDARYLDAARRTSDVLVSKLEVLGWLPATYDASWAPQSGYECLTGTAQLGGVWLRLYEVTGDRRFLSAGLKAIEQAAARQSRLEWAPVRGALAGSYPIYGRYAPLQYPNWATKFLVDGLLQREAALFSETSSRVSRS